MSLERLESRELLAVTTFQQGAGSYTGNQDTILYSITPTVNYGTETGMSVDQQDAGGVRQGLVRFDNIIGSGPGQIPLGSTINSATLTVQVFNDSNTAMQMSMYRMLTSWDQSTATWNSFGAIGGVQASEGEVEGLPPDAILFDAATGTKTFNVATSLRHWASGETNFGWLFESAATNGWDFNTSEASLANRPILTVDYTPPSGAGQFQFLNVAPTHTEGDSGTTVAMIQVNRIGGSAGAVDVDYTIGAGGANPATAGVDFAAAGPTMLHFADGETVKTVPVTINGDVDLEGLETLTITLSNATGGATINGAAGVATLTIGDDDALINEVLANITHPTDVETNREYIELIGTPGASLNGYYFVVFEGEEEENSGAGSGIADFVVDLTGQTFGANGLLVITGTSWAYTKDAATNQFAIAALDGTGGVLEDSSQTYALIRSATNPIVQGTDYDAVGAYEPNPLPQLSIGTGVGILDQLPAGAQMVDSVGVVEGGGGDRDRVATTAAAGHPGVHVHQPEGFGAGNTNTTSDAVSRRFGQRTPSTIGVWFNGDVPNGGATPVAYVSAADGQNGAFSHSVVSPGGAVITPGAPNILRNVFFSVTAVTVDESAGTATLTVERSGDSTGAISVSYATVNGTALAGQDFTDTSGVLNFGIGDSFEDIVIPILSDSDAEGFESFGINLTNPTNPFLITDGSATVTISDGDVLVKTFQDFVDGYTGTSDSYLNSEATQVNDPFGFASSVIIDEETGTGTGSDARPAQGLLRFDELFGAGANQVPAGSQIFSAFLTLNVLNPSPLANIRLFTMLQAWDEATATWSDPQGSLGSGIINGVTPDGVEASSEADAVVTNPAASGLVQIPLNRETIQAWANDPSLNLGWAIISDSPNDWNFASADDFLSINPQRPKLTILYTAPTGQGTFGFSDSEFKVNENGTATVRVNRVGGSTGTATVNYEITAGTGSLGDINGPATGALNFADGELFKIITIPINNDTALEPNETLNLTLTGTGLTFSQSTATLTIRDNDFNATNPAVLLSEFFINSPGNDALHEFGELTGMPGAGLGSLYLVIVGGDVGEGEGSTDLVVDLGPYMNGSNGTTLITALTNWGHRVPTGATEIARPELNNEIVSNDTASYMLLYSPSSSLLVGRYDYDWDNDGSLELPAGVAVVDSIAVKDNGVDDQTYGPAANIINSQNNPNLYVADAISRGRGNATRNSAAAWFHGDLIASGDDGIVYDAPNSTGLPSPGTSLSPGEINTGSPVQSPLVSLISVTPNVPAGTISVAFNGPISQLAEGDGSTGPRGTGITITNADGTPNGSVNVDPVVTGFDTNTLTLAFTGPGVTDGRLPPGNYALNFVGNSLIGNGRAVDAANTAAAAGSDKQLLFNVVAAPGDYNQNGAVDAADYVVWRKTLNTNVTPFSGADGSGNGVVDQDDYHFWRANFGNAGSVVFPGSASGSSLPLVASISVGSPLIAEKQESAVELRVSSATVDSVFIEWPRTTYATSVKGSRAALSARGSVASATKLREDLLMAVRTNDKTSGQEPGTGPARAELVGSQLSQVDDFFAKLGERSIKSALAG